MLAPPRTRSSIIVSYIVLRTCVDALRWSVEYQHGWLGLQPPSNHELLLIATARVAQGQFVWVPNSPINRTAT